MSILTHTDVSADTQVPVAVMARIVEDLLTDGAIRLSDAFWIRQQAEDAGLDADMYEALESLRMRLLQGDTMLMGGTSIWWP